MTRMDQRGVPLVWPPPAAHECVTLATAPALAMYPDTHNPLDAASDREKMRTVEGEPEPWRRCYAQMSARLLLYARQILYSGDGNLVTEAEDVVQVAFVRFWRKHPDAPEDQYGLLFAAVRTAALDAVRRWQRRICREDVYVREENHVREDLAEVEGGVTWFEEGMDSRAAPIQRALQRLPVEQREVVVLKVWGELTFAQIAETLQAIPNTVASRYRLAMKALRKELEADGRGAHG